MCIAKLTSYKSVKLIAILLATLMVIYSIPSLPIVGPERAEAQTLSPDVIPLPSPITLARTQSAFSVNAVENGQLTITYMVINSRDEEVGEILLATTLEDGVTLSAAEPTPDQSGQNLAFVLPTIPPYGQVTAILTVNLPTGPGPLAVDTGARAFGNLRTRAVEASLCPTTLKDTIGVSTDYLQSTIDANTSDRYVLQKAGELGCGNTVNEVAQSLFEFVQNDIGYEVYRGSLRGARGTLWSHAGNALDQASLLVALLRASGIPSRYVSGNLNIPNAQELILSMFDPVSRVVGGLEPADLPDLGNVDINDLLLNATQYLPGADEISDPANDPELLDEARQHFWVEYFDGSSWIVLDPAFESAQVGQTFSSANSRFAEVDDAMRHKVRFRLDTEMLALGATSGFFQISSQFDELFSNEETNLKRIGSVVVAENTVLDQTRRTVELVGEPVSIGHFVDQLTVPGIATSTFNTYSPWMKVGDSDELIRGEDYEEVISTAGSNIVAGVFLRMKVVDAQGNEEGYERALVDRIGFPIRQGEGGSVDIDSSGQPVLSQIDIVTVDVLSAIQDPTHMRLTLSLLDEQSHNYRDILESEDPNLPLLSSNAISLILAQNHATLSAYQTLSGRYTHILEEQTGTRAYANSPLLTIADLRSTQVGQDILLKRSMDLRKNGLRVIAGPNLSHINSTMLRGSRGLINSALEEAILADVAPSITSVGALSVLTAANEQGISTSLLEGPRDLNDVDNLALSNEARARIRVTLEQGRSVIVPNSMVLIDGSPKIAWLEIDPSSGEIIGVNEEGNHSALLEYLHWVHLASVLYHLLELGIHNPPGMHGAKLVSASVLGNMTLWICIVAGHVVPWICVIAVLTELVTNLAILLSYDPPLGALLINPEPGNVLSNVASTNIFTLGTIPIAEGTVSGQINTDYSRYGEGIATGSSSNQEEASLALYPKALTGIGASGYLSQIIEPPNFVPSIDLSLNNSVINLSAKSGFLTLDGTTISGDLNVAFNGFQGTLSASDDGPTDAVDISGTFERVLLLSVGPEEATTDQNTAVSFTPTIQSNADDTYTLSAEAPEGWTVELAEDGTATITPAPGLTSGTYEVRFHAQSETVSDLRAEAVALITVVPPATSAIDVRIVKDDLFSVPQGSTLVQNAYRIEIQNLSVTGDTFDVSVSGLAPEDFTLAADSVYVGPGETGIVGIAIHPASGLAAPGTPISFSTTATGRATGLTDTESASFTYPEVLGVTPSLAPSLIATTPGSTVNTELTLASRGNVSQTFTLTEESLDGLVVSGVPVSVSLGPGASQTLPLTISVPPDTPVGTNASLTVVADLCNGAAPEECTVPLPSQRYASLSLSIGTPETVSVLDTAVFAANADLNELAGTLQDLGEALSRLSTDLGSVLLQSRSITAGNALMEGFLNAGLDDRANCLRNILLEIESGEVARINAALGQTPTCFGGLSNDINQIANQIAHGFDIRLVPSAKVVSPNEPAVYTLRIESTGTETSTINLSLAGLPAGITAELSQSSVVLIPGQVIDGSSGTPVTVTLSSPDVLRPAAGFSVTGQVSELPSVIETVQGSLAVLESAVDVVSVTPTPGYVENGGDPIAASAEIFNTANVARTVSVTFRVEDNTGNTVFTGVPTIKDLPTGFQTTQVDLTLVDTTGFANGSYAIIVQVQSETGTPVPGRQGRGVFLVGAPLVVNVTAEPSEVPPGSPEQVLSKVTVGSGEPSDAGTAFPNQYAKIVGTAAGTTDPQAALGPPDQQKAIVNLEGALVLDMGEGLDRVSDGPGPDLVVFQSDLDGITLPQESETRDAEYRVEVAGDIDGPYFSLGINDTSVDDRRVGDEFDLFSAGITSARFVRITPVSEGVAIDAVLANHTHQPGTISIEHFTPTPCSDCWPITQVCGLPACFYSRGILNSPVIGDLTADGSPEIVVTADTINPQQHETIVINGITKTEELRITLPEGNSLQVGNTASPAIGDIDGDGQAEIVINSEAAGNLLAVKPDGTELFRVIAGNGYFVSPALENVDGDPYPEILGPGGFLQHDGTPGLAFPNNAQGINQPVSADLDADGNPELVMAHSEYGYVVALESDGTVLWQTPYRLIHNFRSLGGNSARPVVADLDSDGRPDLVFVGADDAQMNVTVLDSLDGSIMWQKVFPKGGKASRPAVADINGDSDPEIVLFPQGASSDQHNYVIALDKNGNELWRSVALDPEGNPPSISAADLDGDGAAEVLWNGARSGFTIFDGKTGNVLYRNPLARSLSAYDYPVVADVDADGHLEVVTGSWDGLYIFGNDGGWGGGRKVWNQSDYRITNVNDDLSIPEAQPESWQLHNTYLFQEGLPQDTPEASLAVEHKLGASVTFQPSDITPAPTQVIGQQVDWTQTFPVTSSKAFTVPVSTPSLQPGETLVISESTTVNGTLTFIGGQVVNVSIPVGPVLVHAPHIIGIDPVAGTVAAGDVGEFTVNLKNVRNVAETFTFEVLGVDPGSVSMASSVLLEPDQVVSLTLGITTPITSTDSTINFMVVANGDQGTVDAAGAQLDVTAITLSPVSGGSVNVGLSPATSPIGQGNSTDFIVVVTNTGNQEQTFDLTATLPAGITGEFQNPSLTVPPGLTAGQQTILTLTSAQSIPQGDLSFSVTATETSGGGVSHTANGTLTVANVGVTVELLPETAVLSPDQTATFQVNISNTGNQTETFNLSIAGALGAFACMGTSSPCPEILPVSLAAGGSQVVDVTVSGLNGFLQQRTILAAQAASETYPQIVATDASVIDISAYRDVAAEFDPTELTITSLEPAEFLLKIKNSGNACDERYTLELSSDPAGVILTPETTQFLVPPQKTAALGITAGPPAGGTFTIQARVIAQTDNSLCPTLGPAEYTAEAMLIVDVADFCGNGIIDSGEECDDGNSIDGDCCSATCQIEPNCLSVLTTSGPCDVNEDGVVNSDDNYATPQNYEDTGNVCQELNALGGFAVTHVTPTEFEAMTAEELANFNCIVLDTKPANVTGLGTTWHSVIGTKTGERVYLTHHDALWHSYFNRVVASPEYPDDRFGPETLIRDAVTWVCTGTGTGLAIFDVGSDNVSGAGFTAIDSLPSEWQIVEDFVGSSFNAVGTDIISGFEFHQVYGNLTDAPDPSCDESGLPSLSTVPNSISSFPSPEYFSCVSSYSDESYDKLFRGVNEFSFTKTEQAFSKANNGDLFPDLFPSDDTPIDGFAISLLREDYEILGKTLVSGPEEVGINLPEPTQYTFEITYSNPNTNIPVRIVDMIPAQFEIISFETITGTATYFNTAKGAGESAKKIEWDLPAGTVTATLTITIQTVESPGSNKKNPRFKPTSCGSLLLNDGARAFEVDPQTGEIVKKQVVDAQTGETVLVPVLVAGPSNLLVVEAIEGTKPCAPKSLSATLDSTNIELDWDNVETSDQVVYNVYRSDNGEPFTMIDTVTDLMYTDIGLSPGEYCYVIKAEYTEGIYAGNEGNESETVCETVPQIVF